MPSTHQTLVRVTSRGINQGVQRHLVEPDHFWDGLNLRPVNGRLEQTPWIKLLFNVLPAVGEPDTPTRLIKLVTINSGAIRYLLINETNARIVSVSNYVSQVLLPVVLQTAQPTNATLTGQCLLYGFNTTDFAADTDSIDVTIDTASTFKWRRNGGAWSAGLPIQQSTAIGANGLYVSFQGEGALTDFVNFTPGDTWTWTRTSLPSASAAASTQYFPYSSDVYGNDVYIGGVGRNILRYRNQMITTVGYSRTYGMHVAVFFGHLFVSQFAQAGNGISDPYDSKVTPFTLGWSHLNNPDQFFSTLINEADQKVLPQQQFAEYTNLGITGLAPWRSLLFVFLADSIWNFQYVGLPNVFQASQLNSNIGSIFRSGVIRTPQAIYFIGRNDFYKIDEFEPTPIGRRVRNRFFEEISTVVDTSPYKQRTFGFYNSLAKEVVWTYWTTSDNGTRYQARQVVYNEQTDDWYFRNVPCLSSGQSDPYCAESLYRGNGKLVYGYTQVINADCEPDESGGLKDTFTGATPEYTKPYFETPFLNYGNYFNIKQSDSLYIDAYQAIGTLNVYRAVKKYIGEGTAVMSLLSQSWTDTLSDQRLSLPRDAFRSIAYKFEFNHQDASTPATNCIFNLYQEFFIGPNQQIEK
jgi:hypothetical protein